MCGFDFKIRYKPQSDRNKAVGDIQEQGRDVGMGTDFELSLIWPLSDL